MPLAKRYIQLLLSASDPAVEAARQRRGSPAQGEVRQGRPEAAARAIPRHHLHQQSRDGDEGAHRGIPENHRFEKTFCLRAKEILLPLRLSVEQASPKAFAMMEAIIRHYNFFQVQTIDKFINALLSGCALQGRPDRSFQDQTNAWEYLEYALDQTIDRAAA